jgi:hypothetical protein
MSSYVNTQLLECNRLHSEEAKSGNNSNTALFTNKLGSGVKLDVGDVVSVHAAYISDIGAAGDTIELTGKSFGKFKEFEISNVSNTLPWDEGDPKKRINGYKRTFIKNETVKRELFDNKASIKIGFYMNSMGENTVQLPRRFVAYNTGTVNAYKNFQQVDSVAAGMPFHSREWHVRADYKNYLGKVGEYKQKIDNTRFTIFAREESVFDNYNDFEIENQSVWMEYGNSTYAPSTTAPINRQASLWSYKEFSQIVDLEVPTGFNSPENIASSLTDQLKRPLQENSFTQKTYSSAKEIYEPVCTTVESATYKPFNAASSGNFNKNMYTHFTTTNLIRNQESYDYLSCFQFVGYKRPQIQTTGRALPLFGYKYGGSGTSIFQEILFAQRLTTSFVIDMEYNAANCALYNDFFKSQALYPELWADLNPYDDNDNYNTVLTTVETSRWLHLNTYTNAEYINQGILKPIIGGDNCIESASLVAFDAPPIFFEYNSTTKDQFFEYPSSDALSYGCMDRVKVSSDPDVYKIKFYTQKIGGIPRLFFGEYKTKIEKGRLIGFDIGFQAWSTLALLPFSGYNETDISKKIQPGYEYHDTPAGSYNAQNLYAKLSQVYIGSVDPLIKYDSESSRFKISRLHTLLRQGQSFVAGRPTPVVDDEGAEVSGAEVIKINPTSSFALYCPDLAPTIGNKTHGGDPGINYPQLNLNYEPWLVYDAYSGIYIDDFGFDSSGEGLWSVLGFTTEQFNATLSASNVISNLRVDNINKYQLNRVTTNAELLSKDYPAFIENQYGANMFTQQIVSPLVVYDDNVFNTPGVNTYAPVSLTQTSIEIVAKNLPRRMLRPYYLLKSNIIDYNSLLGSKDSGQNFNIAGIIDKQYSGGDFFFFTSNTIEFTITKPITLTSIQNSIHDPDGSFASINSDSSIIYKIQKTKNLQDLDVLNQILKKK